MTYEKIFNDVKKELDKSDASKLDKEFAFQMNIIGEGAGSFYVAFKDGSLAVEPYDYRDNNASFFASGEDYIKLAKGTLDMDKALETNHLGIDGDKGLAMIFKVLASEKLSAKTADIKKEVSQKKNDVKKKIDTKVKEKGADIKESAGAAKAKIGKETAKVAEKAEKIIETAVKTVEAVKSEKAEKAEAEKIKPVEAAKPVSATNTVKAIDTVKPVGKIETSFNKSNKSNGKNSK